MTFKNKAILAMGLAACATFAIGFSLRAQTAEVVAEDVHETAVENAKSAIAPPVYLGCSQHDFAVREESGLTRCVICGQELKPLAPDTAVKVFRTFGWLSLRGEQLQAAAVASEPVQKRELFSLVRVAGKVTEGPQAAAAEAQTPTAWVYAQVALPESRWIRPDSELRMTAKSVPGWTWEGKLSSVRTQYDAATGTLRFWAEVADPERQLKLDTEIDVAVRSQYMSLFLTTAVLAVPREALSTAGGEPCVWVDRGQGDYEMRKVKLDPLAKEQMDETGRSYYPVLSALSEGELVVTRATFKP